MPIKDGASLALQQILDECGQPTARSVAAADISGDAFTSDFPDPRQPGPGTEMGFESTLRLFYTLVETRALLGHISHATAYRLIARGALDARKILGKTVITGASIARFAADLPKADIRPKSLQGDTGCFGAAAPRAPHGARPNGPSCPVGTTPATASSGRRGRRARR